MYDLVIKNGTLVNADSTVFADIAVSGEQIAAIGKDLPGRREIDAEGKLVIPGGVDTHVHLSLDLGGPIVSSDDFFSGTRAAAFGGTTTVVPFIHPGAGKSVKEAFNERRNEAEGHVTVDYGWHMNIGPDAFSGPGKLRTLVEETLALGIVTFKLYMAYGYRLDDVQLFQALEAVGKAGGLSVIHAENWDLISLLVNRAVAAGETHPRFHERCRPAIFEAEAAAKVIAMAEYLACPVEIFHIGNRAVAEVIAAARRRGTAAFGETCPQYLFLTTDAFEREGVEGAYPVCSPPIRSEEERQAMWSAIAADDLQIVATDHCPFTRELKEEGLAKGFQSIPGGVPSMEMRMASIYSHGVASGLLSPQRWVSLCCATPARLHGFDRKGVLAPGFDADIVIFDPLKEHTLSAETLHEKCGWTPYEGLELKGAVETTILRGNLVTDGGEYCGERGMGRYIHRSGIDGRLR
jgi:dihydropyrimidinase